MVIAFEIPGDPPRATAQQKGMNRQTGAYYKTYKLRQAEKLYTAYAMQHRPPTPFVGPVGLTVIWFFPTAEKRKWWQWKTTRPDTDNMIKALKDCLTRAGFWRDDAQVAKEVSEKWWADKGSILITVEEL